MSKLSEIITKQLQPLIDANKEKAVIIDELLGAIKVMAKTDNETLKTTRETQLGMVDALRDVQATAETIGYPITNKQIAEAYGKSTAWVSRTFGVAGDSDKRTAYIAGSISITGNALGDKKESRIKEAHLILIEEKKPINARILATESGESLEDCIAYLEAFVGSLAEQVERAKKTLLSYFTFTPRRTDGKPDTSKVSDDSRIELFAGVFANMGKEKETGSDVIRRAFQKTLGKLGYEVTMPKPKDKEATAKAS